MSDPQPMPQPFPQQSTNGMAIAGFVTALICCSPLGIIFSAIGLSQINQNPNQQGKGLAIAGLIIGLSTFAIGITIWILSLYTPIWDEFWTGFNQGYYGN